MSVFPALLEIVYYFTLSELQESQAKTLDNFEATYTFLETLD
jgi:hypothetical protein